MKIDVSKLRIKQLEEILNSKVYKEAILEMIKEVNQEANKNANEKTIETRFDQCLTIIFHSLFKPLGYDYRPTKEESVETFRAVSKGRADTTIGNVVIEFKQPSTLSSQAQKEKALDQAKSYIEGFNKSEITKTFGMVTDGKIASIYTVDDFGYFHQDDYTHLNYYHVNQLIQSIIGLNKKGFSAENLAYDFAENQDSPARKLAKSLFHTLNNSSTEKTYMLLTEWKHLFKLSHDDISQQQAIIQRRAVLSEFLELKLENADMEYKALFALQTSYTILIKLIAFNVISQIKYNDSLINYSQMISLDNEALQYQMEELESGSIIRDYGISNLLEGDFFSWYSTAQQWNEECAANIREMITLLSSYRFSFRPRSHYYAYDFFKNLYYAIIPREVRHSLGEYYTPGWLAEHVVNECVDMFKVNNHHDWRALDPTCGSGTFLSVLITRVINECMSNNMDKDDILKNVTDRITGIDLNPLAVLTARVNYFLNVSSFISHDSEIEIPVYSGDSAYTPEKETIDDIVFLKYSLDTEIAPFPIYFPEIGLKNLKKFSRTMTEIELDIKSLNPQAIMDRLLLLIPASMRDTSIIKEKLSNLANKFVEFEENNWNGIWARIITNYLTTMNIGKFDLIVGNPPWVDWKNLPSMYREKIKNLDIAKTIFSGDSFTGGINLNIGALITNVVISNWLSDRGVLGMLMPDTFLVQRTYEGYRNLALPFDKRAYFSRIDDWGKSGDPFHPVTQNFYTYYITFEEKNYYDGIPVMGYIKKQSKSSRTEHIDFKDTFNTKHGKAIQLNKSTTNFTILQDANLDIEDYKLIASDVSAYRGREGIEFYPQEMLIFENIASEFNANKLTTVQNIQVKRSKFRLPQRRREFEKDFLAPLIKGADVTPFHYESKYLVPFAYDENYDTQIALPERELRELAPRIYRYFLSVKPLFEGQSSYSKNLINGKSIPFYSLARVGKYTFAPYFVVYRDNTKNVASVVERVETPWGESKMPVFQNHAVTISQRPNGEYISKDEAYYIAGIINSKVVNEFIKMSSDSRSFPINPRYQIPLFDVNSLIGSFQNEISELSKIAHENYSDNEQITLIQEQISVLYLEMLKFLSSNQE